MVPPGSAEWTRPWVQMKYFSFNPVVYPNMVAALSRDIPAGGLVNVYDRDGQPFGMGLWNAKAKVPLRVLQHGTDPLTEADLDARLERAVKLRRDTLHLDGQTNAYRVVFSDGDGIPGLTVDRYADVLSIEVTTLAVWVRLRRWLAKMHEILGTTQQVIHVDPEIGNMEGMRRADVPEMDDPAPESVRILENGMTFQVNFTDGHKTGFFCDQRDNRKRFGELAKGKRVLDLCCYTGGFSLAAKLIGQCDDVTAVDLDEKAIEVAKTNANINRTRLDLTHCDAFTWGRTMIGNARTWDAVVLDPPKFLHTREGEDAEKGAEQVFRHERHRHSARRARRSVRDLLLLRPAQRRGVRGNRLPCRASQQAEATDHRPHRRRHGPPGHVELPGRPLFEGDLGDRGVT